MLADLRHRLLLAPASLAILLAGCITPPSSPPITAPATQESLSTDIREADFERDRQSILAMAGDYEVSFNFTETIAFQPGYTLQKPQLSKAHEVVRVIEDRGNFISLQHILVVGHGDTLFPVKHWRQDWQYEPEDILVFIGANAWERQPVSPENRKGAWSQTVYQVDDAPRYGALAKWSYDFGIANWTPPHTWRPLPRRDMTTRDDYHAINAVNRHVITPAGWVHEQDNDKLALDSGSPILLARETGLNTYVRNSDFAVEIATDYWASTEDFWSEIRKEWLLLTKDKPRFGLTIQGETEALYMPLLETASELSEGTLSNEEAVQKGRDILRQFITFDLPPLQDRVAQTPEIKRAPEIKNQ